MNYKIRTAKEIYDQMITEIENEVQENISIFNRMIYILKKSVIRILVMAFAGAMFLLYKFSELILKEISPITCTAENLEKKGELIELTRKQESTAITFADINGDAGSGLKSGTLWNGPNGLNYIQKNDILLTESGSMEVEVECLTPGTIGNLQIGEIISIVSPVIGIDNEAVITSINEAYDKEDIEDYRVRYLEAIRNPPKGGTETDYIRWTKEISGITKVYVYNSQPGVVAIYPLIESIGGRIPSQEKVNEVHRHLTTPERKPMCATIIVSAPLDVGFRVKITKMEVDTIFIRQNLKKLIGDYLYKREPDPRTGLNKIFRDELEALAVSAGTKSLNLTFRKDSEIESYSESYELLYYELAHLVEVDYE